MKKIALTLLILLCAANPGWGAAITGDAAINAYSKGNYTEALNIFQKLAEDKTNTASIGAQYNIGYMYDTGKGVPQNFSEAAKWYRQAAEQGHPYAQNSLGDMYASGQGLPQDLVEAYKWFALAAEQGHPTAGKYRDMMAAKLTPERLEEAKRMVAGFKPERN